MRSKFFQYIAIIVIFITILIPSIFLDEESSTFFWKFSISVAFLTLIITILFYLLVYYENRKEKRSIYIAANNIQNPLIKYLKNEIRKLGWYSYPEQSILFQGERIKKQNLVSQISASDLLVLIWSTSSLDDYYVNHIYKEFKKQNKPIFIFLNQSVENIPEYLKNYIIIPLPNSNNEAINLIIQILKNYYVTRHKTSK